MLSSSLIGLDAGMKDTPSLGGSLDCWQLSLKGQIDIHMSCS